MPSCYDPQIRGGPSGGGLPLYFIALIKVSNRPMNRTTLEFIVSFQWCKFGKKTIQVSNNHPMNRITLEFILLKNPHWKIYLSYPLQFVTHSFGHFVSWNTYLTEMQLCILECILKIQYETWDYNSNKHLVSWHGWILNNCKFSKVTIHL
jgi:hypothetical protein